MRMALKEPVILPLCVAALFLLTVFFSIYPCFGKVILYPIYREFKKNSMSYQNARFNVEKSENFRVHYQDSSRECIEMVIDNAEKSLKVLIEDFDYKLDCKIDIIIYPEYREMAKKIGLGTGSTAMGVYYSGIISILEPKKWIRENSDIVRVFTAEGPVLHELTHYVIDYKTCGNVPVWFTEGMALYEEYKVNNVQWAYGKNIESFYSPNELQNDFYSLDEISAYKQSFIIVKYIEDNFGNEAVKKIIGLLKSGSSLEQAFIRIIKMDMKELFIKAFEYYDAGR